MTRPATIYPTGVIHGRFQVLHNDHLKYLLAGKACCRHLVVGITNPDPFLTKEETVDPGRSDPQANPLTYFERQTMVRAALKEAELADDDFTIVPLPINLPERYPYYVPMDAVFFLAIYDGWGRRKRDYFTDLGLRIHVLREVSPDKKGISAGQVRARIASSRPWAHLVPASSAALIKQWDLRDRLAGLANAK